MGKMVKDERRTQYTPIYWVRADGERLEDPASISFCLDELRSENGEKLSHIMSSIVDDTIEWEFDDEEEFPYETNDDMKVEN